MLSIQPAGNINGNYIRERQNYFKGADFEVKNIPSRQENLQKVSAENLMAYHPAFTAFWSVNKDDDNSIKLQQYKEIKSRLDKKTAKKLETLKQIGILDNNNSNDGSSVQDNLYKIISEPRLKGLNENLILTEVINALENPFCITQKFGDIPQEAADNISKETGEKVPESAKNVTSSSCVAASMEFNLADRNPAEFARFAAALSGENYAVDKHVKISDFSENFAQGLWKLREFNTTNKIDKDWNKALITLKPDRNAIIRARVQTSYKDPKERSCVDVLIQSAILNFASQNTYNSITDERTGKYNPDKTGLTDFEKNFAEQVIFETPKLSVVYQILDENGILQGYSCSDEEKKKHILKSLELGQNVIIGYTHMNENKKVDGGHEITIIGYEQGKNGDDNYFVCNDTDDELDEPIRISENKLLPLIHHAGIIKEALNPNDEIVEPWSEYYKELKAIKKSDSKFIRHS